MYSLDRDVARSFLHAPTDSISYRSMLMRKEDLGEEWIPPPHPNAQLGCPTSTNIIPMYYDVIIDTVTDYDIFYPVAKQRRKYYADSNETPDRSRYQMQRSDELAVAIDFPHDYDSITNYSDYPPDTPSVPYQDSLQPMKNVRFDDHPTWIPYSKRPLPHPTLSNEQYYPPHPEDHQSSSVRYITTPFFWFRPVVNQNYAICIPTSRPSLHAYLTTAFAPDILAATPNPVRL